MSRQALPELLPGIAVLITGALIARSVAPVIPGVESLLLAILLGIVVTNTVGVPDIASPGVETHKLWLATGIVLMGASLTVDQILESGVLVLSIVIGVTAFTLLYIEFLSRHVFDIRAKLSSLLAAGSSICGVSAVVAVAGGIQAREEHIAYAAATVLLFDAATLFAYPILGELLTLPDKVFGIWAGVTMFSTGPVVAAGFTHSTEAGQWATVTKLTRNALIGLVALAYASYYTKKRTSGSDRIRMSELWTQFPKFIVGFMLLMLVASAGVFSEGQLNSLENAYNWFFLVAFVGLGMEIRIGELRQAGIRPVVVVSVALITASSVTLAALLVLFG
jgi:uncharacterized integral membrane protein (TIGR00698 family)